MEIKDFLLCEESMLSADTNNSGRRLNSKVAVLAASNKVLEGVPAPGHQAPDDCFDTAKSSLVVGRQESRTPETPIKNVFNSKMNAHMLNYQQIKNQIEIK